MKSDIMRGIGKKDANFKKMVDQIKEFLQEHVEIDHVIGHSLGGALAVEGVKDVGREVRVVVLIIFFSILFEFGFSCWLILCKYF